MKILFKRMVIFIGNFFFQTKYLKSEHFSTCGNGWKWILRGIWFQKVLGFNRKYPVPCHHSSKVSSFSNLNIHPSSVPSLQSHGLYISNWYGNVSIGKDVFIAPNVGIITSNHDLNNPNKHQLAKDILIEDKCWIGMNSVLLPGVHLKENTVVGAGTIVNKSFGEGGIVIAGTPAKIIKRLNLDA